MGLGLSNRLWHERVPLHLWERDCPGRVSDGWLYERSTMMRESHSRSILIWAYSRSAHCSRRFVVEVGHQHRSRLEINHAVATRFDLLKSRGIDSDGGLGRPCHGIGLWSSPPLDVAVQRNASIFGMYSSVMSE